MSSSQGFVSRNGGATTMRLLLVLLCILTAQASAYVPYSNDLQKRDPAPQASDAGSSAIVTVSRSFSVTSSVSIPTSSPDGSSPNSEATTTITASLQSSVIQATTQTSLPTALPQPFDTSLGSNFTNPGCPTFFANFLKDTTFQTCYPFSLLLQNSNGFFQSSKSVVLTTKILDASCGVDYNTCANKMSDLANGLRAKANCGGDFDAQNPLVRQAYAGLISYQVLYQAGCQRSKSGSYCYADAITNSSSPTDGFVYYLPLGVQLPLTNLKPSCNSCLQKTMEIFQVAATNTTQILNSNYAAAAVHIDSVCGSQFVNTTVPSAASSIVGSGSFAGVFFSSFAMVAAMTFLM